METIVEQMINDMREDLKKSGDYDSYGETGIRIAVYEDLRDTLKHIFSDVAYNWVALLNKPHHNNNMTRIKALQHLIWQEQQLQLFRPGAFNRKRLNRLMRELQELGGKTYEQE